MITKMLRGVSNRHDLYTVWADFLELSAIAISNGVSFDQDREDQYLKTAGRYDSKELMRLKELFHYFIDTFPTPGKDVLGKVFMELGIADKWKGQFFTPDDVCDMMTLCLIDKDTIQSSIDKKGFISMNEPSIGGGANAISFANHVTKLGFNHQRDVVVTGVDVDIKSVHMSYVQLSLMGVRAVIVHGNTLSMQEWSHWYTPMYVLRSK